MSSEYIAQLNPSLKALSHWASYHQNYQARCVSHSSPSLVLYPSSVRLKMAWTNGREPGRWWRSNSITVSLLVVANLMTHPPIKLFSPCANASATVQKAMSAISHGITGPMSSAAQSGHNSLRALQPGWSALNQIPTGTRRILTLNGNLLVNRLGRNFRSKERRRLQCLCSIREVKDRREDTGWSERLEIIPKVSKLTFISQVYLSNATFVIENGNSHRHDNQAFLGCGGATGEEDKQWCDWNNVLNLNVTTNLVSITDYAALGLGTAETNPSW